MVLPASLELASPPYHSGVLPHERKEPIGARSIESNVHLSRYKPEALPVELCGHARAGLARFALSKLVLAAGVEPTTSRLRSACTAVVLRQQSSFRLAGNQRPGGLYRPRERLMPRGAQPETLSFKQGISHAPFGRERFSRTRAPSDANLRRTEIAIFDWCRCCGPFRSLCLLWRRVYGPPPVNPVFLVAILVRTAHWSDAENRTPQQTTNANHTTD